MKKANPFKFGSVVDDPYFTNRVNEETRKIQIEVYTQEAINNYILEEVNWDNIVAEYDADNESFKLTIDNIHTIIDNAQEINLRKEKPRKKGKNKPGFIQGKDDK